MIKEEVENIFGFKMRPGKWDQYAQSLSIKGEPTRANMTRVLFAVCKAIESLESKDKQTIELTSFDAIREANAAAPLATHPLLTPQFECPDCSKSYTTRIALLGHSRGHKKKSAKLTN